MAVFRIERSGEAVSGAYLRDGRLSLKAKGLLTFLLAQPDNQDYTMQGLSLMRMEEIDDVRDALRELNRAGYIRRTDAHNESGRRRYDVFAVYDRPQEPIQKEKEGKHNGTGISH